MKREARLLHAKSLDSLFLALEYFNRPSDRGRVEAVLIFLDRAFELFLKAAILHSGGRIREPSEKHTIGFEKCVRKCVSDAGVRFLEDEEALTIQMINSLRDAAQHYLLDVSEQELYLFSQAGVTLYGDIQERVFTLKLSEQLPARVLPVTTSPPQSLAAMVTSEITEVRKLLRPGRRKRLEAKTRLRSLAIIEASLGGERTQPTDTDLDRLLTSIGTGLPWQKIFPGVASLNLTTQGTGLAVSLRITKNDGDPVFLVPEGTPGATTVAIKKVDKLAFFNLGLLDLAKKCEVSSPKALAIIDFLEIKNDPECFAAFRIGSQDFKRYSQVALDRIKRALPTLDLAAIWSKHKPKGKAPRKAVALATIR
jgi:hypothetical protein